MKEKLTDSKIDQTFKEAIDPLETQPSDKFWTEASDSILERANSSYIRKVRIWKMTSFALASMLVCLLFYTFYTGNKINSIQQQVTTLQKQQVSGIDNQKLNTKNTAVSTTNNQAAPNPAVQSNENASPDQQVAAAQQNSAQSPVQSNSTTQSNSLNAQAVNRHPVSNSGITAANNPGQENISSSSSSSSPSSIHTNNNEAGSQTLSSPESIENSPSTPAVAAQQSLTENYPAFVAQRDLFAINPVSYAPSLATGFIPKDGAEHFMINDVNPLAHNNSARSRFSIGIFAAPSMTGELNNTGNGNIYSNDAESGEKANAAFDGGINIDYAISKRWAIESGVGYHSYSFTMQPTLIWAKKNTQGQVGYSIVTSCGILLLPYQDAQLKAGDNVHANGKAYCGYLSVPLQAKYKIVTGKHIGLYLAGGFVTNFTIVKGAFIHWSDSADQDDESIHSIQGLSQVQFSYVVGAGLSYYLGRGFSIFDEPFMNGAITPIDKNTPIISYPYYIGMRGGLSYNF